MITPSFHLIRALAATAALLLAAAPVGSVAQEKPQPLSSAQPQPAPQAPAADDASTTSQSIHPGDHLAISVYGEPTLTQVTVVQADGTIQYPLVGRVFVAGLSAAEARDALAKQLQKYLKHPNVSLAVQQQGAMSVTVLGNVKAPGKFQLRSGAHISEAIAAAGGLGSSNGEYPVARVTQSDGSIAKVNLQQLIRAGDATQNVVLDDNALVYVTGAETIRVVVLGAVSRPGNVDVNEGDRLTSALARAGAEAQVKPDLNRVLLTRVDPGTGKIQKSYEINVYQALRLNDPRYDPILMKDDRIFVPEASRVNPFAIGLLGVLGRLLGF
jgi:protein involved in polysaccharide export with SLBB domain